MIRITINNHTAKVTGDTSILNKVYQDLAFKHPDAYHIRKHMRGDWDGMVYPLTKHGVISNGLLTQLEDTLVKYVAEMEVVDNRIYPDYRIVTSVGPLILRPYQVESLEAVKNYEAFQTFNPRGIIAASVGAGKTLIALGIYEGFGRPQTLILVNNTPLYDQWKKDLEQLYPDTYGFMKGKTHKVGNPTIAMAQTSRNRVKDLKNYFNKISMLLVDEADVMVNDTLKTILKACPGSIMRYGFTGTAFTRKLKKDALRNHELEKTFGPAIYEINSEELSDLGFSTKTQIKIIGNPIPHKAATYIDEVYAVSGCTPTFELIRQRLEFNWRKGHRSMMVYNRFIKVAEDLYQYLKDNLNPEISLGLLDHTRYKKDPTALEDFKVGKVNVMVNTLFLQRGLNLPKVSLIINNAGGDYPATPLQILGRGVRLSQGKEIFIFEDLFYNAHYSRHHEKSRLNAYKDFGYTLIDLTE